MDDDSVRHRHKKHKHKQKHKDTRAAAGRVCWTVTDKFNAYEEDVIQSITLHGTETVDCSDWAALEGHLRCQFKAHGSAKAGLKLRLVTNGRITLRCRVVDTVDYDVCLATKPRDADR